MKPALRPAPRLALLGALAMLLAAGCSTRQGYAGAQAWLAEECRRTANEAQYQRCLADAQLSYETYQRRRAGLDDPTSLRR